LGARPHRVAILFNGEIYNFRERRAELAARGFTFRTATDTEVALTLYLEHGAAFVDFLRGMFTIAIFDFRESGSSGSSDGEPEVILARGPLAMKPLYIAEPAGERGPLLFSSELRALLASRLVEPDLDPVGLADFLRFGFVLQPSTIFKSVRMLEPGFLERYRRGRLVERRECWRWSGADADASEPVVEDLAGAAHQLRTILAESIRIHAFADAPVGVFLSGGVDSTAITALMRPHVSKLKTFTLRFPENREEDEADAALETARALDCDATVVDVTGADVAAVFPRFAADLDQPSSDGLNSWLVSRAASASVKAALSGLGGDEWFAGYSSAARMARVGSSGVGPWLRGAGQFAAAVGPRIRVERLRRGAASLASRRAPFDTWVHGRTVFGDAELASLMPGAGVAARDRLGALLARNDPRWAACEPLEQAMLLDVRAYMACQLLRDSDACSMAHSLEIRAPLVDVAVARFAQRCPPALKLAVDGRGVMSKRVLIEAIRDVLPSAVMKRRKRGFTLPYAQWLRGPMRELLFDTIHPAAVRRRGIVDHIAVGDLFEQAARGDESALYPKLWSLLTLELWHRGVVDEAQGTVSAPVTPASATHHQQQQ
jgi:asparagine synthase (glutamine-hydrolysing)